MILAAHQPNFIPWLPFFDKMNKADVFVILANCQFEKNGWQNRAEIWGEKWTMPVRKGTEPISEKVYVNGSKLLTNNLHWICAIATTLGIDTSKLVLDKPTVKTGTERIASLCLEYKCDQYLSNPESIQKYLNQMHLWSTGITIIPHEFPYKKHVFEAFDDWGIEGTQKLLKKEKERWKISVNSLPVCTT